MLEPYNKKKKEMSQRAPPVTGAKIDRWVHVLTNQFLPPGQVPPIEDVRAGLYLPFYDPTTNNQCDISLTEADHPCYYMGNQPQTSLLQWYNQDALKQWCEMGNLKDPINRAPMGRYNPNRYRPVYPLISGKSHTVTWPSPLDLIPELPPIQPALSFNYKYPGNAMSEAYRLLPLVIPSFRRYAVPPFNHADPYFKAAVQAIACHRINASVASALGFITKIHLNTNVLKNIVENNFQRSETLFNGYDGMSTHIMMHVTQLILQGTLGKEIGAGCDVWFRPPFFVCVQPPASSQYVYFTICMEISGDYPVSLNPLTQLDFIHRMKMNLYFNSVNAEFPNRDSDPMEMTDTGNPHISLMQLDPEFEAELASTEGPNYLNLFR